MRYVLAGFAGALLAVFLLGAAPATQDVVRCRRLEIVDGAGNVCGAMYFEPKSVTAHMELGPENDPRIAMWASNEGATAVFTGTSEEPHAIIAIAGKEVSAVSADGFSAREQIDAKRVFADTYMRR